jgi:hypothetical protein
MQTWNGGGWGKAFYTSDINPDFMSTVSASKRSFFHGTSSGTGSPKRNFGRNIKNAYIRAKLMRQGRFILFQSEPSYIKSNTDYQRRVYIEY